VALFIIPFWAYIQSINKETVLEGQAMSRDTFSISKIWVQTDHSLPAVPAIGTQASHEQQALSLQSSCKSHEYQSEFSRYLVGDIQPAAAGNIDWGLLVAILLVPIASLVYSLSDRINWHWRSQRSSRLALHH
jgi:hypothetical protein